MPFNYAIYFIDVVTAQPLCAFGFARPSKRHEHAIALLIAVVSSVLFRDANVLKFNANSDAAADATRFRRKQFAIAAGNSSYIFQHVSLRCAEKGTAEIAARHRAVRNVAFGDTIDRHRMCQKGPVHCRQTCARTNQKNRLHARRRDFRTQSRKNREAGRT